MRMGRQHPPEADASSGRGGQGEPAGSPAQEVRSPGAAQLRRPEKKGAEPAPRGSLARDSHGWRAAATFSPGAGAHSQLAVSPGRSIHGTQDRPSLFAAVPNSRGAPGPDAGGRAGAGSRRRAPGGRAAPPPVQPRFPRLTGGGSGGALWPRAGRCSSRAGRCSSRAEGRICLWQARHAAPPPLRRPALLSLLSPPLAPAGIRSGRGEGAARQGGDPPGTRGGAGRGARPPSAGVSSHPLGGCLGSSSREPSPAFLAPRLLPMREWRRQRPRSRGESCLSSRVLARGLEDETRSLFAFRGSGIWGLSSGLRPPLGDGDGKERLRDWAR